MKPLTIEGAKKIFKIAYSTCDPSKMEWKNSPEASVVNGKIVFIHDGKEIDGIENNDIYKSKLDGVYSERYYTATINDLVPLINNGYQVIMGQYRQEPNQKFDANGWLVFLVEGFPIFHLAPWDIDFNQVYDLVSMIPAPEKGKDGKPIWRPWCDWRGTDKKGEFETLGLALMGPGVDFAKEAMQRSVSFEVNNWKKTYSEESEDIFAPYM